MSRVTNFHVSAENPEELMSFYREMFGWEFEQTNNPRPTWFIKTGEEDEPGIDGMLHTRERDSAVVNTIETKDMSAAVAAIERLGGHVLDRRTIPGAGELVLFADPEQNVFQLRQPPT